MNDRGWSLFRKGLARRRKEVRWLRGMMALAVFLTAFVLLFQDNINEYVMQNNYRDYGRWLFRVDEGEELQSPYLLWDSVYVGGEIQRLKALTEDVIEIGDSGEPAPKSVLSEFDPENPAEQLVIPEKEQIKLLYGYAEKVFLMNRRTNAVRKTDNFSDIEPDGDDSDIEENIVSEEDVFASAVKSEIIEAVKKEVDRLPPLKRKVMIMMYYEEMKTDDIARELGMNPSTLRSMISNTYKYLRKKLEKYHDED